MEKGDSMSQWHILMHVCLNRAFPEKLCHERYGRENRLTETCVQDLVASEWNLLQYCGQDR